MTTRTATLWKKARSGSQREIKALLDAGAWLDPDAEDERGWTALLIAAAYNKYPAVIQTLLDAGANPNATDNRYGESALTKAVTENRNLEVVKALLAGGATPNYPDERGRTTLMAAVLLNPNLEVIQILLDAGADPQIRDKGGKTALDWAIESNAPAAVRALLEANPEPDMLYYLCSSNEDLPEKAAASLADIVELYDLVGYSATVSDLAESPDVIKLHRVAPGVWADEDGRRYTGTPTTEADMQGYYDVSPED